ncbi:hypothetical protein M8C21_008782 [Ambrosia artemisiifolia]|uniref:Uncharacterized protein n=1 Tax=Ambrosia artemisiifolia TaxID=4212 RepID=A0AAD5DAG2_AMBAR|nr:hypothetical protein M8C21_008782 [Ambrosia artemisiifolia]
MLMPQKPFNRKSFSRIFEEQNISNNHQGKSYLLYELDAEIGHKELDVPMSGSGKCRQLSIIKTAIDGSMEKMAQLPEGITEPLEHEKLPVPLLEVAQPLSNITIEFPDIYTGCYRKYRAGPLIITLEGKAMGCLDQEMVEATME